MKKAFLIFFVALSVVTMGSDLGFAATPVATPEPTTELEMIDRRTYWDEHPDEDPRKEVSKAHAMARVAEAVCPDGASEECLSAVMCCVWNRTKANGFPNTIEEVASQPNQWQGLAAHSQSSNAGIKLARELLQEWESGEMCTLPIPRNCVFLTLGNHGIWFRSEWNGEDEVYIPYYGG